MATPILSVKNLQKKFGQYTAVENLSFDIHQGEILGLLGPNGAGKTTTIQMLLGVMEPDRGEIIVFNQNFKKHRQEIMRKTNFSSAYISFPGSLYVDENLKIFAKLYNVKNAKQKIDDLLVMLDISELKKKAFYTLSSGQKTRAVLAKALLNNPKLLLLDEPTASLDPEISHKIRNILRHLTKENGVAILYTSHNMAEVEALCDRVIFLNHGKIIAQGTPAELAHRIPEYQLILTYLDPPERMRRFLARQMVEFDLGDNGQVKITLKERQIPELLRQANQLDFKIINIDMEKPKLEDVFLKISRGCHPEFISGSSR
ncbi:MAG: ABC transporter ATP-binding protein [Candidatus Portnoybacteria bacterium CG_4_10_14_0_2_um_filter_39_11]|uniref:ABC transporter ATP-binding protein n=1 Tax=Candidatus Portnoybacteria bacterium CG_4_10_14_0_2_um_filter_39_11 TaxID=1974797 RepID=A0A2M7UK65_9BACT|nr:MAG: ABC transporter ATP-binding protein [Candidatus Portnoybacteria bacterium CG_4_10_14_0_2_um_filter_39_11]